LLLEKEIKKHCSELLKVCTGAEVVELCRNHPDVDLILMDIQLPIISGYEATRQIRQFNRDVVIIAQTAYGLTGDREKALDAGCNDYLAKPVKRGELIKTILKWFMNETKQ
jgi:CheY-like chemotaxis protein